MLIKLSVIKSSNFIDYSNETDELTVEILMEKGFSIYEASAYLSKINVKKISEKDNGCNNEKFNPELRMPRDRMKDFKNKKENK